MLTRRICIAVLICSGIMHAEPSPSDRGIRVKQRGFLDQQHYYVKGKKSTLTVLPLSSTNVAGCTVSVDGSVLCSPAVWPCSPTHVLVLDNQDSTYVEVKQGWPGGVNAYDVDITNGACRKVWHFPPAASDDLTLGVLPYAATGVLWISMKHVVLLDILKQTSTMLGETTGGFQWDRIRQSIAWIESATVTYELASRSVLRTEVVVGNIELKGGAPDRWRLEVDLKQRPDVLSVLPLPNLDKMWLLFEGSGGAELALCDAFSGTVEAMRILSSRRILYADYPWLLLYSGAPRMWDVYLYDLMRLKEWKIGCGEAEDLWVTNEGDPIVLTGTHIYVYSATDCSLTKALNTPTYVDWFLTD